MQTKLAFAASVVMIMALAAIFLRTPCEPRCSYSGLSTLHKIILSAFGLTVAGGILAATV